MVDALVQWFVVNVPIHFFFVQRCFTHTTRHCSCPGSQSVCKSLCTCTVAITTCYSSRTLSRGWRGWRRWRRHLRLQTSTQLLAVQLVWWRSRPERRPFAIYGSGLGFESDCSIQLHLSADKNMISTYRKLPSRDRAVICRIWRLLKTIVNKSVDAPLPILRFLPLVVLEDWLFGEREEKRR